MEYPLLQNRSSIIDAIKLIANALGNINDQVIYVGGAVVGLYADTKGAPEVRPTKDIDIVVEIASVLELEKLRQELADRGIHFAKDEKTICRFIYKNVLLDVMATQEIGWAPANPWFKSGFDHPEVHYLGKTEIKIMPLAFYLASKFVAFNVRGTDPRTSKDLEDIIYILDNRSSVVEDIIGSEKKVKAFLIKELAEIFRDPLLQEAVLAHLESNTQTERYSIINQKIEKIIGN